MAGQGPRVAVVGAGIGGLAAALALSRAGFRVDVYEQAPHLWEVGVGMHLGPNGSRILHRWGLGAAVRAVAVQPVALEVRHWRDNRLLVRQPMGEAWELEFGAPHLTVHRAHLHRLLAAQLPAGCLRPGHRLIGFADTDERVELRFSGGARAEADALIGADGVHSTVRRALAGPDDARFSGNAAFRGTASADQLAHLPAGTLVVWSGPGASLFCYPVDRGRTWTLVAVVPDPTGTVESWSAPGESADLAAAFDGWAAEVRKVIDAVRVVGRWALYDRDPLPRWTRGRVTLLGDAAHPMLPHQGQGASQALEDAVALAYCLTEAVGAGSEASTGFDPVAAALARYDGVRRPHATKVQLGSRNGGTVRLGSSDTAGDGSTLAALVADVSWIQHYDVATAVIGRG